MKMQELQENNAKNAK